MFAVNSGKFKTANLLYIQSNNGSNLTEIKSEYVLN